MKILNPPPADTLQRTDWFDPTEQPTIPGHYECTLGAGSGHTFLRKFDGEGWHSPITNMRSRVQLPWRGIVPGSIDIDRYPATVRSMLIFTDAQNDLAAAGFHEVDFSQSILFTPPKEST